MRAYGLFDGRIVGVGREVEREACLSVERHGVFHDVFLQVVFVADRPLCVTYGSRVSQLFPKLLAQVGGKGREQHDEVAQDGCFVAFQLAQFVYANHESTHRSVIGEVFDVYGYFLDELMDGLEFVACRFAFLGGKEFSLAAVEERPELLQKAVYAVYAVRVPRFRHFDRTEEHLVHAQCVGAILFNNHVGVDYVVFGFAHFLDSPPTNVFAVLKDELCVGKFRTPGLEGFKVEHVVRNDVDIDIQWGDIVLVFQAEGNEGVGVFDAIDEVAPSLDHALVD